MSGQPNEHKGKFLYQPICGSSDTIRQKGNPGNAHQLSSSAIRLRKSAWYYNTQPWVVNIYRHIHYEKWDSESIERHCSGIIISEDWILTAAHCVEPEPRLTDEKYSENYIFSIGEGGLRLLTNDTNRKEGEIPLDRLKHVPNHLKDSKPSEVIKYFYGTYEYEQFHEPEIIISHEYFKVYETYHDIALIKLKDKLSFNDHIFPACLPAIEDFIHDFTPGFYKTCYAIGMNVFGTDEPIKKFSNFKHCVDVRPDDDNDYHYAENEYRFLSCACIRPLNTITAIHRVYPQRSEKLW